MSRPLYISTATFFLSGYVDVAGCSAEFVNNVLKKVDLGDKTGGLDIEAGDN